MEENKDDIQKMKLNIAQLRKFDNVVLIIDEAISEVEKKERDIKDKTKGFNKKIKFVEKNMGLVDIDANNIARSKSLDSIHYSDHQTEKWAQKIIGAILGAVLGVVLGYIISEIMISLVIGAIIGGLITGKEKNIDKSLLGHAKDVEQYINIDIPRLRMEINQEEAVLKEKQNKVTELKAVEHYQLALSVLSEKYANHEMIEKFIEIVNAAGGESYTFEELLVIYENKKTTEHIDNQDNASKSNENKAKGDAIGEINSDVNSARCPHCGQLACIPTTDIKSKGYGYGKGCCGLLFFGPLGLLFGLCGKGVNSSTWWHCNSCGKRHRAYDEVKLLLEQFVGSVMGWSFFVGVCCSFALDNNDINLWNILAVWLVTMICVLISCFVFKNNFSENTGYKFGDCASEKYINKLLLKSFMVMLVCTFVVKVTWDYFFG